MRIEARFKCPNESKRPGERITPFTLDQLPGQHIARSYFNAHQHEKIPYALCAKAVLLEAGLETTCSFGCNLCGCQVRMNVEKGPSNNGEPQPKTQS